MPFAFGNAENITDRMRQIDDQPPVHLPDSLEMVFYSAGQDTTCETSGVGALNIIVAEVPIQNGGFNVTGTDYGSVTPVG